MDKLYNQLVIYRNVLKFKTVYDYQLIGILSELCFTDIISGIDLKEIINSTYNTETEITDTTKLFFCLLKKIKNDDLVKNKEVFRKELYKWICEKVENLKTENNIKDKPNMLDGWIK